MIGKNSAFVFKNHYYFGGHSPGWKTKLGEFINITAENLPVTDKTPKKAEVKVKKEKFSNTDKFYSPLVRSIAKKENISLKQLDNIKGSGYNGRVNKTDMLNFINSQDSSNVKTDEDILESNVDLPAFGNPTNPISAIIFNSSSTNLSSPYCPSFAFLGVIFC